jgi:predicted transcriptional regulator
MLTRQERERLVVELYNQNKTYREIAKEVRICPRDIGSILKKASGEVEEKQSLLSPSTQAYRLFSEGKAPVDVAIALDLSESDTTKFYEEYLKLKQMNDLRIVYDEIGSDIMHFLELYKLSKDVHMNPEQVVNLLQIANNYLPLVEKRYKKLIKEIDFLESEKQKLKNLANQIRASIKILDDCKREIKNLQKKKIELQILISSGRYEKIRKIVDEEVTNVLSKRRDLLKLAVASVLESLMRNPDNYNFLVSSSAYNGRQHASSHPYVDVYKTIILDEADKLFELMVQDLTNRIIHDAALTIHPQTL